MPLLEGRLSRAAVFASALVAAPACGPEPQPQYIQQPPPPPPPPPDNNGPPPDDGRDYAKPPPDDPPPPPPVGTTTIRGVITNGNTQTRYANVRVELIGRPRPQVTMTNAAGEYVFTNVAPGDYRVEVRIPINPRAGGGGNMRPVKVDGTPLLVNLEVYPYEPRYDNSNIPKPYGAPPARKRVV